MARPPLRVGDRALPRAGMERAAVIAHRVMTLLYQRDDGLWVGATDGGGQYTYSAESLERVES